MIKGTAAFKAHIALAKLGNASALREINEEIDQKDPRIQDIAIDKLYIVGGKPAFQKLYQLLDDTVPRDDPACEASLKQLKRKHPEGGNCDLCCDLIYFTRSEMATWYLSKLANDPPTPRNHLASSKEIPLWKGWFRRHKELLQ